MNSNTHRKIKQKNMLQLEHQRIRCEIEHLKDHEVP